MNVAVFAFGLLIIPLVVHIVWWRVRLPRSQTLVLLTLFLGSLPTGLIANWLFLAEWPLRLDGVWQHVQVCLFHITMSLAYVEFYTAVEHDSPSSTILLYVEQAGDAGCTEDELYQLIDDDFVIGSRLQAMVRSGVVTKADGEYRLAGSGRVWARVFQCARWVYRLELGS